MTDPKNPTPPLTAAQMQEKLRSGDFRIESAPHGYVDQYTEEVDNLLEAIGEYMSDNPKEWACGCFVSDQSQLGDFFGQFDCDAPTKIMALSKKLGFKVDRQSYIYEIAARMHGVQ